MPSLHRALLSFALLAFAAPCLAQSGTFGNAVIVGDGELIIAEPNNYFRPGLVWVYRKSGNEWREAAQLRAPDAERADGFGAALAVTGNTLFVAQRGGRLHTFTKQGDAWGFTGTISAGDVSGIDPGCNQYGYCGTDFGITLAADGDWLLVGDPGEAVRRGRGGRGGRGRGAQNARPGVVHVFRRAATGAWSRQARLTPANAMPGDRFGAAIALANDRALIGAPNAGAIEEEDTTFDAGRVYEFRLENGTWREAATLASSAEQNANFGATIALRGDAALIGAPGAADGIGAAYLYRRDNGAWSAASRLAAFNGMRGDRFGSAVAFAGDDAWVGAPVSRGNDTGMVYLFTDLADDDPIETSRRMRLTETVARDAFGDRIVASANVTAIAATGMHHQAGAVIVYERDASGAWQDAGRLVSPPDGLEPVTGERRECIDGRIGPYDCSEVELLAFMPGSMLRAPEHARGIRTNDNWGWTDAETGREYALVGRNDGTSFVDITDPVNPVLVGDLPKTPNTPPTQLWRDIKTYRDHAFIVADGAGNHGMQVFDLRQLRNVQNPPALFEPDVHYTNVASVHNIAINEETGFAYLVGADGGGESCGGGLHMVDIREPRNPRFVGCFRDQRDTHDVQCATYNGPDQRYQGREICFKSNASMFAISDVTDKQNPVALSRISHPNPA